MAIVFKDFGTAYLAAPLAVGGLTITVDSPSSLPVLQAGDYFYLVLQKYSDRSYVEIVKVTATAGSTYTVQRGQAGTVARAFALGDYAELRLTVDALSEFIAQGIGTKMDKSGGGDFVGQYRFLNSSTSRIDIVRTSDNIASSVALDFSASEGHRAIFGGPTGSNATTPSILFRPNGYGNGTGQVKIDKDGLVDAVALVMRGATQRTEAGAAVRYDELDKFVPKTRTVNGHDFTTDFSITADEAFAAGATVNRNARFQAADFQYRQADGAYGLRFAVSSAIAYLQGGKTDSSVDQKMHLTGWMGNPLSSFKVYAENPLTRRAAGVDYPLYDALNKPAIADVTGLADALLQAGGKPVLSADWVQLRSAMWNGFVAADGQTLNRADYPDAWSAIESGLVPLVADSTWVAHPQNRGCFTVGDGSTTFRVPDYNGKYAGSLGAAFLRGDGLNAGPWNGNIQGDAIRNITGSLLSTNPFVEWGGNITETGALKMYEATGLGASAFTSNVAGYNKITIDTSLSVPTAADNHPVNVTGCWAIKLFGAVQNAGSIDAAGLATQLAAAQSRIAELETWPQSGSNANGSWVKHRDGTMKCRRVFEVTAQQEGTTAQGIYYGRPLAPQPFPIPFVGIPVATVTFMPKTSGTLWAVYSSSPSTTHWPGAYPFRELPIPAASITICLEASGWWK